VKVQQIEIVYSMAVEFEHPFACEKQLDGGVEHLKLHLQ
jgi:hypothetical protein